MDLDPQFYFAPEQKTWGHASQCYIMLLKFTLIKNHDSSNA